MKQIVVDIEGPYWSLTIDSIKTRPLGDPADIVFVMRELGVTHFDYGSNLANSSDKLQEFLNAASEMGFET